ncbi:MAG: ZPR1 zinc finger domain-containing protein [Promethearchaeota archaeon]
MPNPDSSIEKKTDLNRKEGTYELPEITSKIVCPVCSNKDLTLTRTMYHLPDGDDVLIMLLECGSCHYKKSDIINMYTAFKPGEYRLIVDDADFSHKIFRGATGDLEIPEIGMIIERGHASTFDFTNVEGILLKMEKQLKFFTNTTPVELIEWKNANEALKRLNHCITGELHFTVILRDRDGGSYITPTRKEKMIFTPYKMKNEKNNEVEIDKNQF